MSRTPERLADVFRIAEQALARDGAERAAYLDTACAADADVRRAVEAVLAEASRKGFLETPPSQQPPAKLHNYRIVGRLGIGGMGEVYAAEDLKLGRRVALKVLPPDMAADPERLQRFQREARAVAALNHPNIVTIYTVEEAGGIQFLTMELVEGRTLRQVIPRGGLPLEDLLKLAVPLVEAVAFAHDHGIVHRDLKPSNIMLAANGRVKVLDFGLAKLKPDILSGLTTAVTCAPTESLTAHHEILGTPSYMSPEQAAGRVIDHRSDIFSLGVVLYEMASGRRPFEGDTPFSVISSILKDTPPPLSAVSPRAAPALDRIVRRALEKSPDARYQRALDLRDDLASVRAQTGAGRLVSGLARAATGFRWPRRFGLAAAAIAVVALVAGGGWYLLAGRNTARDRSEPPSLRFRTTRLSAQRGAEQFPSLLPDGKWILYAGQEEGNRDIYLLSTSGHNPINLTVDSKDDDDEPAASPNGELVAFRSSRGGGGIFVMGRTGEGVRRITPAGVSAAFNPAWSPDGNQIVYATENVQLTPLNWEGRSELWVVDLATGTQRRLDVPDAVQPNWSPHGHRVAFASRPPITGSSGSARGGHSMDIYTVPARGGAPVPAMSDQPADWSPVWSHDGRHLYFVSDRGGSMNLWRVPIDEESGKTLGEPEPITTPAPYLAHPTISADGRRIAYTAVSWTSNVQRLAVDPATLAVKGEPVAVTSGSRMWLNPDPTPDGELVVFYSRDQPEGDLYVCRPDGTGLRQLTSDVAIDRVPRWSPDKQWVAFFSNRGDRLQVWKIRAADGSGLQDVTEIGTIPVWSPDGSWLATAPVPGIAAIVDPNRPWREQTPEQLPLPDQALRPFVPNAWSPDGAKLAGQIGFSDSGGNGVVLYTFASRTYERLTDFGEWPVWLGDSRRLLFVNKGREFWVVDTRSKEKTKRIYSTTWDVLGPPRLTRDGRTAFFSRRATEGDIYLLTFE